MILTIILIIIIIFAVTDLKQKNEKKPDTKPKFPVPSILLENAQATGFTSFELMTHHVLSSGDEASPGEPIALAKRACEYMLNFLYKLIHITLLK